MKQKIYKLDAFTDTLFSGNQAAVCPLEKWLPDELMQNIAMENNLAETAFIVPEQDKFRIRWFTPAIEVDLCGHATLAAACVLFNYENFSGNILEFQSRSGLLTVKKENDLFTLNFPADNLHEVEITNKMKACFNLIPTKVFRGITDHMFIFENETQIKIMIPDLKQISELDSRGVIITARGDQVDFVSRFFAPQSGIDEDPVTGSAHTSLTVYWRNVLEKDELTAKQLSKRGGFLKCSFLNNRIEISGSARLFMIGELYLNSEQ